jgi:hypothetical protein
MLHHGLTIAQTSGDAAALSGGPLSRVAATFERIVDRMDILMHPEDLLAMLQDLGVVWGGVLLVVGVLCVLNGYRWHRWVIIICAFICGFALGYMLSQHMEQPYIVAGALALMAAVVANPLLRFSVAFFGGLTGAFVGANIWTAMGLPPDSHWAGALMGLTVIGMASFLMFKHVIVFFTSIGGSAMAVCGAIAMLLYVPDMRDSVSTLFTGNQSLIPLLIAVAAVIGLVLQEQQSGAATEEE